jgi:hypothetical protein
VKVSDYGNLISFESQAGREAVFGSREGYAVRSAGGGKVHAHGTGDLPADRGGVPSDRHEEDHGWQVPAQAGVDKPDATEKDVTVTMTLTNLSSAPIEGVLLSRSGDFDIGDGSSDQGALTTDSAWLWDDESGPDVQPVGLMLTALTFGTNHSARVEAQTGWSAGSPPPLFPPLAKDASSSRSRRLLSLATLPCACPTSWATLARCSQRPSSSNTGACRD